MSGEEFRSHWNSSARHDSQVLANIYLKDVVGDIFCDIVMRVSGKITPFSLRYDIHFLSFPEGSTSYADSEDEDYQDAGSRFRNSALIEDDGFGNSSAALVSRIEKQRVVSLIERSEF